MRLSKVLFAVAVLASCLTRGNTSQVSAPHSGHGKTSGAALRKYGSRGGDWSASDDERYHEQGGGNMNGWSESDDEKWHRAGNPYPEGYGPDGKLSGYDGDGDDDQQDKVAEEGLTFIGSAVRLSLRKGEFDASKQAEFKHFIAHVSDTDAEDIRITDVKEGPRRHGSRCSLEVAFAVGVPAMSVDATKAKLSAERINAANPPEGLGEVRAVDGAVSVLSSPPQDLFAAAEGPREDKEEDEDELEEDEYNGRQCKLIGLVLAGILLVTCGLVGAVRLLSSCRRRAAPAQPSAGPAGVTVPVHRGKLAELEAPAASLPTLLLVPGHLSSGHAVATADGALQPKEDPQTKGGSVEEGPSFKSTGTSDCSDAQCRDEAEPAPVCPQVVIIANRPDSPDEDEEEQPRQ